jgi:hypothetical protein
VPAATHGIWRPHLKEFISDHLFVKTDDGGRHIIRRQGIQTCEQSLASRLLAPLEDGEVIRIEDDSHASLLRLLPGTDEATETNNFRESLISREVTDDLSIPGFCRLRGEGTVADLAALRDAADHDDCGDELAFVREWFPVLVELYQRTHANGRVLVIESI